MSDNAYPEPLSDPAASGIPEYADDDSTANPEAESSRQADGPSPAALPIDRDDTPLGVEEFEPPPTQGSGDPLTERLDQEEPDVGVDVIGADDTDTSDAELSAQDISDPGLDEAPRATAEVGEPDGQEGQVGRLVQPDEGGHPDTEKDAVASDAGTSGGGASAEELAMHEERDTP